MRARVLVAGLLLAGALSCGREAAGPTETLQYDNKESSTTRPADAARLASSDAAPGTAAPPLEGTIAALAKPPAPVDPMSRMIIRTGSAAIEVDSLEPGIAGLRRLAAGVGGYVANASLQGGREQVRQAVLELKVPAERFDDLTGALEPIGRVEFLNVAAEDVGEEYVDLGARAQNARRLEERLLDLLGTRTGRLQDVLSVERELARVREEIERMDGRLRYLKTRAALSTLSVTLHEPPPVVGDHPGRNLIAEAFRQAWRNFAGVLAGSIAALGYLLPAAALGWAALLAARRLRRQPA